MKQKRILIVGAGFLQSFVIKKAREMGYYVIAVDGDENAIGFSYANESKVIDITDVDSCCEYASTLCIDGVLTAATDYGVLTAAKIANKLGLPGIDYEVAKLIKNKYQVRKRLYEKHADDTKQAFEVANVDEIKRVADSIVYPVMVKPCDGSGSRGASKVCKKDDLFEACSMAIESSLSKKALIESFVFGKEYGAESFVLNGEVSVLGVMQKWMTKPPYYAELGHAIPNDLSPQLNLKIKKCVSNAIKALGVTFGSVNMDLIVTKDGDVHIVDVGARMGGNMIGPCVIPYGTGIDYIGNLLRASVNDQTDFSIMESSPVCTRIIAFDNDSVIEKQLDFHRLEEMFNVKIFHHLFVGNKVHQYHTNLDGLGYVVAKAPDVKTAEKNADSALSYIKSHIR